MAIKIILAVSMLPVLLIMYGACWFLAGEKNGTLFGVGLRGTARNTGNKEALQKGTEPVRPVLPAAVFPAFLVKA